MSTDDIDLGGLVNMIGVELRIAQILADKAFSVSQEAKMPSGHFTVLTLINLNPGINQSMLAKSMYLDRSTMVPILDQLESKAWMERRKKPGDRRAYALYLTPQGKKVLGEAGTRVGELEAIVAEKMGPQKRD
ncbi:MAG: MarR family transcriptional regulator, partial [Halioglobus sp.]